MAKVTKPENFPELGKPSMVKESPNELAEPNVLNETWHQGGECLDEEECNNPDCIYGHPEGYKLYIKKTPEKENWRTRRARRSTTKGAKDNIEDLGECQKECKLLRNPPLVRRQFRRHPKTNPGPPNFQNSYDKPNEPIINGQIRADEAKVEEFDEKPCSTQGFEEVETEKFKFCSRGPKMGLRNSGKPCPAPWESSGEVTNSKSAEPEELNETRHQEQFRRKHRKDECPDGEDCTNNDCIYGHPEGYGNIYWSA